jgi:Cu+-exporting ATPase
VDNIKNALYALSPKPTFVSPSIVTSWVTVGHAPTLEASSIRRALEDAGFEICSVTKDGIAQDIPNLQLESDLGTLDGFIGQYQNSFKLRPYGNDAKEIERKRQRHIQDCEQCRAEEYQNTNAESAPHLSPVSSNQTPLLQVDTEESQDEMPTQGAKSPAPQPFVVVDDGGERDVWRAGIAIGGMTCASCSNSITKALETKEWIKAVSVNLISNSATVDLLGKEHLGDVTETIEDLGYEATVDSMVELSPPKKSHDSWRAGIAIGGMTCASCSNGITKALQKKDYITNVSVNLISNSGMVEFIGKSHLDDIINTIEDLGYEATLDSLVDMDRVAKSSASRTVEINVSEMFCNHCPQRVLAALEILGDRIHIEKPLSLEDPILKLSYIPHVPDFTIRDILAAIAGIDPKFSVSIYHPPSLEERSRRLHARQQRRLLIRVAFTVVLAIPTFIIGIVYMSLVSDHDSARMWLMDPWVSGISRAQFFLLALSTPVYFFAADVFHRRAIKEIGSLWKRGSTTPVLQRFYRFGSMNMLMSLGTSIAYWSSVAQMIVAGVKKPEMVDETSFYFDSVVFLTKFLLIGRFIEAYSKSKTGDAVTMLGQLRPTEAILVNTATGQVTQVGVDLIELGDTVRVPHGASPPCDGTITDGDTIFDESSLTGESRLVKKTVSDEVFAGTVNKGGPISILISGAAGTSMLDQIVKAVREGQTKRAPIERIADQLTRYFVPAVTYLAVITWIVWMSLGLTGRLPDDYLGQAQGGWVAWSLQFAIAVFVVACPCGLALAAPTALFVGGGLAAKHGILVKGGGEAFEKASKLDCIVFDKTGTLTMGGEPVVTEYLPVPLIGDGTPTVHEKQFLALVQKLEDSSTHTLAKAIVTFCEAQHIEKAEVHDIEEIGGKGMKASTIFEDQEVELVIGNESLMAEFRMVIPYEIAQILNTWKKEGNSIVLAGFRPKSHSSNPATLAAIFAISDATRPEAPSVIKALQSRGTQVWMLSGDNPITAHAIGAKVGISPDNIFAGVLPNQKADKIRELQMSLKKRRGGKSKGRAIIAMVGDGINDSPALTAADVGIAIGSGSDIAISAAEFVLVSSNLESLITLLDLSRLVFRRIKFNFAWALVYNMVALPVAAGALYVLRGSNGEHVKLNPVWASLAMAASSISVVCSSLALRSRVPGVGFRENKLQLGLE